MAPVIDPRSIQLVIIEKRIEQEGFSNALVHAATVLQHELAPSYQEIRRAAQGWVYREPRLA